MTGPVRTCVGCRRRFELADGRLVRVALGAEGLPVVGRNLPGRGAWICGGSTSCLEQAMRRKAFDRALRTTIDRSALAAALGDHFSGPGPAVRD